MQFVASYFCSTTKIQQIVENAIQLLWKCLRILLFARKYLENPYNLLERLSYPAVFYGCNACASLESATEILRILVAQGVRYLANRLARAAQ